MLQDTVDWTSDVHKVDLEYQNSEVRTNKAHLVIFQRRDDGYLQKRFLKRLRVAFSFFCAEKQGVLLVEFVFIAFNPLKRFSCGFLLLVCEKDVFLFLLSVACGFLLLVCEEARRFTCIICFHRF